MDRVVENIISGFVALDRGKLRDGDEAEWMQFNIRQANAKYFLDNANKHRDEPRTENGTGAHPTQNSDTK